MNRRKLLGGVAAGTALPLTGLAAAQHPDAELMALIDRQATARATYLGYNTLNADPVEDALGDAYCYVTAAVEEAPATTLAGLMAKARVAKVELAVNADGSEDGPHSAGDAMARAIVNDLLRLAGGTP